MSATGDPTRKMSLTLATMSWTRNDLPDPGIPDRPTRRRDDRAIFFLLDWINVNLKSVSLKAIDEKCR
jgi:hypothetical protein